MHQEDWAAIVKEVASFEAGPLRYLTRHTKTEDKHWAAKGTPPIAPFPKEEYLQTLVDEYLTHPSVFIAKSRQMMVSWLTCGYITWNCLIKPQIFWLIQSKDEATSAELVEYCRILCRQQEDWISKKNPIVRDSRLELRWQNGSRVLGLPSGVNKVRGYHPHGYFMDEAAFVPEAEECYSTIVPVAKQIIFVSSAGPGWFMDTCESYCREDASGEQQALSM